MSRDNSGFTEFSWGHHQRFGYQAKANWSDGLLAQWAKGGNKPDSPGNSGNGDTGDTGDGSSGGPLDGHDVTSYGGGKGRGGNGKSTGTGDPGIDSLTYGIKWDGGLGTGTVLTYSFGTADSVYLPDYPYGAPYEGFGELSDAQKDAVRLALEYWSDVANITFTEVTDSDTVAGDLRFAFSDDANPTAYAYLPTTHPAGGDIWIYDAPYYQDLSVGTYGYFTILHEIGHALGLTHTHSTTGIATAAPSSIDWVGYSVMSYKSFEGAEDGYRQDYYPTTPMINDIAAIQYIYGTNTTYNSGDTVYSWDVDQNIYETIWDAGGNDTIDWSNQTSDAVINLNSGEWSELGPAYIIDYTVSPNVYESRTLMIAYDAVIENAIGGSGNDQLIGNDVSNILTGGGGADILWGGGGSDIFVYESLADAGDIILDFETGIGGDIIDLSLILVDFGYVGSDPFGDGWVQTQQSGADTLIQVDDNGNGDNFVTLLAVANTDTTSFVTENWLV